MKTSTEYRIESLLYFLVCIALAISAVWAFTTVPIFAVILFGIAAGLSILFFRRFVEPVKESEVRISSDEKLAKKHPKLIIVSSLVSFGWFVYLITKLFITP